MREPAGSRISGPTAGGRGWTPDRPAGAGANTAPITTAAAVCAGVRTEASVDPWCCSNNLWTIGGGTLEPAGLYGGPNTNRVYFTADGSGPVTLTWTGNDANSCPTTNSVTIP